MQAVPAHWRFSFDCLEYSLRELSWNAVLEVFQESDTGYIQAEASGLVVEFEFDENDSMVFYQGGDQNLWYPWLSGRRIPLEQLGRFFCPGCALNFGLRERLEQFGFNREAGFRLFRAILTNPQLPTELPAFSPKTALMSWPGEDFIEVAERPQLAWYPTNQLRCNHT